VELAVLERSEEVIQLNAKSTSRVLILSGEPLNEPVVGHGPFVMNTRDEIQQAIRDYQAGRMGRLS
jgi:redox-sensitive bicupin YhaK (pirin superfamily)